MDISLLILSLSTATTEVLVGDKGHFGDDSADLVLAHLHLNGGADLEEFFVDIAHGNVLHVEGGRRAAAGDNTDLLAVDAKDRIAVASGGALDCEADAALGVGLVVELTQDLVGADKAALLATTLS